MRFRGYWTCWGLSDYVQLYGYRVGLPLVIRDY